GPPGALAPPGQKYHRASATRPEAAAHTRIRRRAPPGRVVTWAMMGSYRLQRARRKATSRPTGWGLSSLSWAEKRTQMTYLLALISGKTPRTGSTQTRSNWKDLPPSISW